MTPQASLDLSAWHERQNWVEELLAGFRESYQPLTKKRVGSNMRVVEVDGILTLARVIECCS
jgi:hypothetical protein